MVLEFTYVLGKAMGLISIIIKIYATLWLITLFFRPSTIDSFFPPYQLLMIGPLILLALFIGFLAVFLRKNRKV